MIFDHVKSWSLQLVVSKSHTTSHVFFFFVHFFSENTDSWFWWKTKTRIYLCFYFTIFIFFKTNFWIKFDWKFNYFHYNNFSKNCKINFYACKWDILHCEKLTLNHKNNKMETKSKCFYLNQNQLFFSQLKSWKTCTRFCLIFCDEFSLFVTKNCLLSANK